MPAPTSTRALRPPQQRVLRNHERLIDAALVAADEDGWSGLNFANVAARAGLSRRPLQDRFTDASHLAAAVWAEKADPALSGALADVLTAAGLLDAEPNVKALIAATDALAHPGTELRAAAELMLVSQFDLVLRSAVRDGLGAQMERWCTPEPRLVTRADAARRGYLISLGLGLLLAGHRPGIDGIDMRHEIRLLAQALAAPAKPTALPRVRARHLDGPTPFDTGDATLDDLLQAVLEQVGADGFDGASVERIVSAAGSSQGALFGRYETKLDLFIDATRRQHAISMRSNHDYIQGIAAGHGAGVADAVTLREFQRPGRELARAHLMEQLRISWHEESLLLAQEEELEVFAREEFTMGIGRTRKQVPGYVHFGYALGLGATALPVLFPACWTLPYDVVTIPLLD
ncbi:MAG: TetR family transcriptional regulator [Actinobacteria bacterium]|nr:TetR family transcriptional regulator [Actinomycetota bacterium]